MAIRKMYYLIVVLLGIAGVSCGPEDERPCCPASQLVVIRSFGVFYCLDPSTNAQIPKLNLTCKNDNHSYDNHKIFFIGDLDEEKYYVDFYGWLKIRIMKNYEYDYRSGEYCFGTETSMMNPSIRKPAVVVCPEDEEVHVISNKCIGICMIISSAFLLLTAYIYRALSELWDLQGLSIIGFCMSSCFGFAILGGMKLYEEEMHTYHTCAIGGFLVYFYLIAAFFWMSSITFQICLMSRHLDMSRPLTSTQWKDNKKEFLWTAALPAWGFPVVLTAVLAIVNYAPGDHIKPGIGIFKCWFYNNTQQWWYRYSVMTILIITNIAIFVYTSTRLWSSTSDSKRVKLVRHRFWMTLGIFVVTGGLGAFEIISASFPHIVWDIINVINALQGMLLFLVLIIYRRRRVLKSMYNHGWLWCCEGPVESYLARGEDVEDEVEHTLTTLDSLLILSLLATRQQPITSPLLGHRSLPVSGEGLGHTPHTGA